ncbi:hypothetical protein ABW19_dt0205058 [Dactylella cylindrospora]|nr:hypothetical protein ABW19_dt0205058 [Dactylella cylindrospora]
MRCCQLFLDLCLPVIYQDVRLQFTAKPIRIQPTQTASAPDYIIGFIKRLSLFEYDSDEWIAREFDLSDKANKSISKFMKRIREDQLVEFIWNGQYNYGTFPNLDLLSPKQTNLRKLCLSLNSKHTDSIPDHSDWEFHFPTLQDLRIKDLSAIYNIPQVSSILEGSPMVKSLSLAFWVSGPYILELASESTKLALYRQRSGLEGGGSVAILDYYIYSKIYALTHLKHLTICSDDLPDSFGRFVGEDRLDSLGLVLCANTQTLRQIPGQIRLKKVNITTWTCWETVCGFLEKIATGLEDAHLVSSRLPDDPEEDDPPMARMVRVLQQQPMLKRLSVLEILEGPVGDFSVEPTTSTALEQLLRNGSVEEAMVVWPMNISKGHIDLVRNLMISINPSMDYRFTNRLEQSKVIDVGTPIIDATVFSRLRVLHVIPTELDLRDGLSNAEQEIGFVDYYGPIAVANAVADILDQIFGESKEKPGLEYVIVGLQAEGARTFRLEWYPVPGEEGFRTTIEMIDIRKEAEQKGKKFRCYEVRYYPEARASFEADFC